MRFAAAPEHQVFPTREVPLKPYAAAVPAELIDTITLVGPRDRVRDRLEVYRDAGVGTLIVSPVSFDTGQRRRMVRELAEML